MIDLTFPLIDLTTATLLGTGNERTCYAHPHDPLLVIKVTRPDGAGHGQNVIEHTYLSALQRRKASFAHIPRYFGRCETTLGAGILCERITDADGANSRQLDVVLREEHITRAEATQLLEALFDHLQQEWIVFADAGGNNLFLQQPATGNKRLVIIDGLGARHPGMRLWLQTHVPWLARRKNRKQWPRLLFNVWHESGK